MEEIQSAQGESDLPISIDITGLTAGFDFESGTVQLT